MKKVLYTLMILLGSMFLFTACADESDEIESNVPTEQSTDPESPEPGCDDPSGCDDEGAIGS